MLLYRYGLLAWVWRGLMLLGIGFGLIFGWIGFSDRSFWLIGFGLLFGAFPIVLGQMVATRIVQLPDGRLRISTLNLTWRTIAPERLGRRHYRSFVQSDGGGMHAPRLWVMVQGGLPIYLDLLADIPDQPAFQAYFPLPASRPGPRRRGREAPRDDWDVPFT